MTIKMSETNIQSLLSINVDTYLVDYMYNEVCRDIEISLEIIAACTAEGLFKLLPFRVENIH